jgi:hypothetical protein
MSSAELLAMLLTGGALIAIELTRSVPAWLRVRRTKRTDGISPVSVGVLAGTSPGWIAVAVIADSPAAALATTLWLAFHLLLLMEIIRVNAAMFRTIVCMTFASALGIGAATLIGLAVGDIPRLLGVAIGCASAAYSVPALVHGMRSKSTAGLSLISLSTNALEGAIYFVAGLGLGGIAPQGAYITAYLFFGGLALLSNLPRLGRTSLRRLTGRDALDTNDPPLGGPAKPGRTRRP